MFKKFLLGGSRFAAGIAMKKAMEFAFDYLLYPSVMIWAGYVIGGIIMTVFAFIINIAIIRAYDWAKVDWLFIEEVKKVRDGDREVELSGMHKWLQPILKKGDVPAFFVLCIDDPVTATLYLRKGSHLYNGLNRKEWFIFAAANAVSNLYWILGIAGAIESFKLFI